MGCKSRKGATGDPPGVQHLGQHRRRRRRSPRRPAIEVGRDAHKVRPGTRYGYLHLLALRGPRAAGRSLRRRGSARRKGGRAVGALLRRDDRLPPGDILRRDMLDKKAYLKAARRQSPLSILSFLSVGSILSAGSILSIGSTGSILSIGSVGSILGLGSAGYSPSQERDDQEES